MKSAAEINQEIRSRIKFLRSKIKENENLESEYQEHICFLQELIEIKPMYVLDMVKNQINEFDSYEDIYQYILGIVGYEFNRNLLHSNKKRQIRVCQRFFISDDKEFNFLKDKIKKRYDLKSYKMIESESKRIRANKKWFNSKTRIIQSKLKHESQ